MKSDHLARAVKYQAIDLGKVIFSGTFKITLPFLLFCLFPLSTQTKSSQAATNAIWAHGMNSSHVLQYFSLLQCYLQVEGFP